MGHLPALDRIGLHLYDGFYSKLFLSDHLRFRFNYTEREEKLAVYQIYLELKSFFSYLRNATIVGVLCTIFILLLEHN